MSPTAWRIDAGHTQATLAALAGVTGRNPSRTWKRWESGERKASAAVIDLVEGLSKGAVTARSWAKVRAEYVAQQKVLEPLAAPLVPNEGRSASPEAAP